MLQLSPPKCGEEKLVRRARLPEERVRQKAVLLDGVGKELEHASAATTALGMYTALLAGLNGTAGPNEKLDRAQSGSSLLLVPQRLSRNPCVQCG